MADNFAPKCLSIDLEVGKRDLLIHQFGAVRGDTGAALSFVRGDLNNALNRLDALADDAAFLLGHNLVNFDLPHLKAACPDLRLHSKPAVDTLWLNPSLPRQPPRQPPAHADIAVVIDHVAKDVTENR